MIFLFVNFLCCLKTVKLQEGEQYAQENGLFFMETSAKTAQNVNELFYDIGTYLSDYLLSF